MLGASEIKELTAKFTKNEALQQQIAGEIEDLNSSIKSTAEKQSNAARTAQNLFDLADDWSMIATNCENESSRVDAERKALNAELSEQCSEDVDQEGLRYIRETMIGLREFVDEGGMCGMGMGMGSLGCEEAIQLSVEELYAMKDVILHIDPNSQETYDSNFCCVKEALEAEFEKNYPNEAERPKVCIGEENGKQYIQIQRKVPKESCVKIYDANGNGALDDQDYSFNCAIEEAVAKYEQAMITKDTDSQNQIRAHYDALIQASNEAADTMMADLEKERVHAEAESQQNRESAEAQSKVADSLEELIEEKDTELGKLEEEMDAAETEGEIIGAQIDKAEEAEETKETEEPEEVAENPTCEAEDELDPELQKA